MCSPITPFSPSWPWKKALKILLKQMLELLRILEITVAVKKLTSQYGCFVLFDPLARNCNGFVDGTGTAIAMLFSTLDAMAHGWISKNIRKTQGL